MPETTTDGRAALLALRNIGPKTVDWLIEVGVRSPADLDRLGTEEVTGGCSGRARA